MSYRGMDLGRPDVTSLRRSVLTVRLCQCCLLDHIVFIQETNIVYSVYYKKQQHFDEYG